MVPSLVFFFNLLNWNRIAHLGKFPVLPSIWPRFGPGHNHIRECFHAMVVKLNSLKRKKEKKKLGSDKNQKEKYVDFVEC